MAQSDENSILNDIMEKTSIFKNVRAEDIKVTRMEGWSNDVYKVESPTHTIVYKKIKQKGLSGIFTRYEEKIKKIIKQNQFGPTPIFEDEDLVIEEYLEGVTLNAEDLHSHDTKLNLMEPLALYSKMDYSKEELNKKIILSEMIEKGLLDMVEREIDVLVSTPYISRSLISLARKLVKEIKEDEYLERLLEKHNTTTELILCHNDFYHLNIIKQSNPGKIKIIDYEYSCVNPFGWDIANLITENVILYDKDSENFVLRKEGFPSYDEVYEMVKAFTIRFKSNDIQEEGANYLAKLKAGKYDTVCSQAEIIEKTNNVYELSYILTTWWLLWCILKLKDGSLEWPMQDYVTQKFALKNFIKEKLTQPKFEMLLSLNSFIL